MAVSLEDHRRPSHAVSVRLPQQFNVRHCTWSPESPNMEAPAACVFHRLRLPGKHHYKTDKRGKCKQRARPDPGHSGFDFCWLAVQVVITC